VALVNPLLTTVIDPDVPVETTALIVVELTRVTDIALVPPNFTDDAPVTPVKFVPVMVTVSPLPATVGEKLVIVCC
jgi:hypothetical protein